MTSTTNKENEYFMNAISTDRMKPFLYKLGTNQILSVMKHFMDHTSVGRKWLRSSCRVVISGPLYFKMRVALCSIMTDARGHETYLIITKCLNSQYWRLNSLISEGLTLWGRFLKLLATFTSCWLWTMSQNGLKPYPM